MANVRTYSPSVRVGNWREDVTLQEDSLRDFLQRRERGELALQPIAVLKRHILKPVSLSVVTDGFLRFGDTVMLVNPGESGLDTRDPCALSIIADVSSMGAHPHCDHCLIGPCQVGGARNLLPCVRNAFIIKSVDGTPDGDMLKFEQNFALSTLAGFAGELYLSSDHRTFQKCAKNSRLQEVTVEEKLDFLSRWRAVHHDPQQRLEQQGYPVPVNSKLLLFHCQTNQSLAALRAHPVWTPYGKECEITAHTFLDSHKAERDSNHWLFITSDPGNHGNLQAQDMTVTDKDQSETSQ